MSHQVLARKWRPKNFDTLVGQENTVQALCFFLQMITDIANTVLDQDSGEML